MGLTMFALTTTEELLSDVDFEQPEAAEDLHEWRKHDPLHEWMEILYMEKGGTDVDFNDSFLKLDSDDLDRMEAALNGHAETLPVYLCHPESSERVDDLEFVAKARAALAAGKSVIYFGGW